MFICLPHTPDKFSGTVSTVKFSPWLHSNPHTGFGPRCRCYKVIERFCTSEARCHREMLKAFSETLQQVGDLEEGGSLKKFLRALKAILRGCCHQLHTEWVVIP